MTIATSPALSAAEREILALPQGQLGYLPDFGGPPQMRLETFTRRDLTAAISYLSQHDETKLNNPACQAQVVADHKNALAEDKAGGVLSVYLEGRWMAQLEP